VEFFQKLETKQGIDNFLTRVKGLEYQEGSTAWHQRSLIVQVFRWIKNDSSKWDGTCQFNIKHVGDSFLHSVNGFDSSDITKLEDVYVLAYRFMCEHSFNFENDVNASMEFSLHKNKTVELMENYSGDLKSQIIYATYMMPVSILRYYFSHQNLLDIKEFNQTAVTSKKMRTEWEDDLVAKEAKVNQLSESLKELTTGYNFVGLYKGFNDLSKSKKSEEFWLRSSLVVMGLVILFPLLNQLGAINFFDPIEALNLSSLAPLFGLELILIYFFRVILYNYKSVKSQLLQVELRKTLCQFIQKYSDYSEEIKSKDQNALDKFENIIFSGIVSESGDIPSTYDGVEKMAEIIKKLKK